MYASHVLDIDDSTLKTISTVIEEEYPEGGEEVMTLAKRLREEGIAIGEKRGMTLAKRLKEEGFALGEQQGIALGAYQKALETARKLKLINLPLEQISKVTDLSIKEIEELGD